MNRSRSESLFEEAKKYFPGGVNSPVRAFQSVGGSPLFIKKGNGARIWDEDDNRYLDFCGSWGPLITGHAHPAIVEAVTRTVANGSSFGAPTLLENELAGLIISHHSYVEMLRFVSSGTESTMSAIRLARGYTGRNKIIKFEGCYHGHADSLLVKAGSGLATLGTSSSAGVPLAIAGETIVLPLDDIPAFDRAIEQFGNDLAGVIIEPVPANNGLLLQDRMFLQHLRNKCSENHSLLIFDEVISGFRIGFEGGAGHFDIQPDILTFGKIIGGGLPVGAYAASREIMKHIAPLGNVYQAGTLSGNPVAMAAGIAQLKECLSAGFYEELEKKTAMLVSAVMQHVEEKKIPFRMFHIGSIFWFSFNERTTIRRTDEIDTKGVGLFASFHRALLEEGVYVGPSGYEVGFVSSAHSVSDIEEAVMAIRKALDVVYA